MSTISKTGSTGGSTKEKSIDNKFASFNKYVDANLDRISDLKLNLTGGKMTGSLDMSNNRVTNVGDPEAEFDVIIRGYCYDFVRAFGDHLKTDILTQIEPDQSEVRNNQKYLHIASLNSSENIKTKKLMSICRVLNDILLNHSEDFTSASHRRFRLKYTWMQNLVLKYEQLYIRNQV